MNFVQMRAFNAVIRQGSISAAAQELGVSKPAVTMQIKALEEALGVRLFHRKGHSLQITETGRQFLEPVRTMAHVLDEIERIARRTAGNTAGQLRIGVCAPFILVPIVAAFSRRYPGLRAETEVSNSEALATGVQEHELDVAIATLRTPHPEFHSILLLTQTVRAIVPVDHPWANRGTVAIEALAGVPCVMREQGSMTRIILEEAVAAKGHTLDARFEFGSREAVKEAVAYGLGVGFVLDREVGRDHGLVALDITGADLSAGEYLFCHRDLMGIGSIKAFIDAACDVYGIDPIAARDAAPAPVGAVTNGPSACAAAGSGNAATA